MQQIVVSSAFHDTSTIDDMDEISVQDGGKPVSNNDRRAPFGKFLEFSLDIIFCLAV
jgi:hypothetical protein